MAELPGLEGVDPSQIFSGMWESLPPELASRIDSIFQLGTILLSVVILYFALLIIIKLLGLIFGSRRLKKIQHSLETTNEHLEEIAGLLKKEPAKNTETKKKKET